jgi:hypothetical protein
MEMSDQIQVSANLPPRKYSPAPMKNKAGWASESVWKTGNLLPLPGIKPRLLRRLASYMFY